MDVDRDQPLLFVGKKRSSSSNQFWTRISLATGVGFLCTGLTMRNCLAVRRKTRGKKQEPRASLIMSALDKPVSGDHSVKYYLLNRLSQPGLES